jgi:hypothetical protein
MPHSRLQLAPPALRRLRALGDEVGHEAKEPRTEEPRTEKPRTEEPNSKGKLNLVLWFFGSWFFLL